MKNLSHLCAAAVLSALLVSGKRIVPLEEKPNIVIIFCDDLGYGDIGSFGATEYQTPYLDQLAMQGMRFTQFYVAEAVCSASRAALLTGCYPNRIGILHALMPNAKNGISQEEKTMAELLKEKNYSTAIFGKWHLGSQQKFLPLQHGFDEYTGLPYSNDMWPVGYDGLPLTDTANWRRKEFPPLPLIEGNETTRIIRTLDDQAELTGLYTQKAVDFINRKKNQPFFLYLAHSMPHVPLAASSRFKGKSNMGLFGDVIMEIDWSVGEIMKALKKNGIEKNTIIIFTSDNGPWLNFGNHAGNTGGLREGKGASYEGGMKVPFIIRWPTQIKAGTICNKMASTIDLLPTFAAITDGKLPEHKIDGLNILSLFRGEAKADPRQEFYYYYGSNQLEGVRQGNWKLVLPHKGRSYVGFAPGKDGYPGSVNENAESGLALYDLRRDPGERYDVKDTYPEIVASLQKLADKAREDLGDAIKGVKGKNVRKPGYTD